MKHLLVILSLATTISSVQASEDSKIFAPFQVSSQVTAAPFATSALSTIGGMTSAGQECKLMVCKEAIQVVNDTQNYLQSGDVSAFLAQKISELQATDTDLSADDSLDILVNNALSILK